MPKQKDYFKPLRKPVRGLAELSVTGAVVAGVQTKTPPGTPSVFGGFSTLASFAPIAATAVGGKAVLDVTKGLRPIRTKKRRR